MRLSGGGPFQARVFPQLPLLRPSSITGAIMFHASKTSCLHKFVRGRLSGAKSAYRPFPLALKGHVLLFLPHLFNAIVVRLFVQLGFLHEVKRTYSPSSAALNVHFVAFPQSQPTTLLLCPFTFSLLILLLPFPRVLHLYRQSRP